MAVTYPYGGLLYWQDFWLPLRLYGEVKLNKMENEIQHVFPNKMNSWKKWSKPEFLMFFQISVHCYTNKKNILYVKFNF